MRTTNQIRLAFVSFHVILSVVIFVQSMVTAISSSGYLSARTMNPHLIILGSLEAFFALMFIFPRTLRAGAIGLIFVFLFATILHLLKGEFPGALLIYGAGVVFIALHGAAYSRHPATVSQIA